MRLRAGRRLVALLALMLLAFGSIAARLTVLQVGDHRSLEALGLDQRVRTFELPAAQGTDPGPARRAARHHARRP